MSGLGRRHVPAMSGPQACESSLGRGHAEGQRFGLRSQTASQVDISHFIGNARIRALAERGTRVTSREGGSRMEGNLAEVLGQPEHGREADLFSLGATPELPAAASNRGPGAL